MLNQIISEFQKNPLEKVVATLGQYKGMRKIDIRIFFNLDNKGTWIPTKKGINLDPDSWGEFKKLIDEIDHAIGRDNDWLR